MHTTDMMEDCIAECQTCAEICYENFGHCLEKGGKHADPAHLRLLLDCADICQVSAAFMSRGSDYHTITCRACAEVCEACAQSCEAFSDDAEMKGCGEECRRCASSCHAMATMNS